MPKPNQYRFLELHDLHVLPVAVKIFWFSYWGILSLIFWDRHKAANRIERTYLRFRAVMYRVGTFLHGLSLWLLVVGFVVVMLGLFLIVVRDAATS